MTSVRNPTNGHGVDVSPTARRHRLARRLRPLFGLSLVAMIALACVERIVTVVPVESIELVPGTATISIGESITIEAHLRDSQGNRLTNREIQWVAQAPEVAEVDANGVVTGKGVGSTAITAYSEGKARTAQVTVTGEAGLSLDRQNVAMNGPAGHADASVTTVTITNAGTGQISGLSVQVEYGTGQTGWLIAALNSTTTPAVLTLRADTRNLTPGSYQATIVITAPGAPNSPVTIPVALTVVQGFPLPTLTAVNPTGAPRGGSVNVTLTGTGFVANSTTVSFGAGITVNQVTVTSPTSLTAAITIDGGAALGPRNVTVTNPSPGGGSSTLNGAFTVLAPNPVPAPQSLQPAFGRRGQSIDVVIGGTGFVGGMTTVDFGAGINVVEVDVTSSTSLTASITIAGNATLGTRDVIVTNPAPGGGSGELSDAFTVLPVFAAPTIGTVVPNSGGAGQTMDVVITGTGFASDGTTVELGDGITVVALNVDSETSLTATIEIDPLAAPGPRAVTVTNPAPGGGQASLANGFTVTAANPAPTITAVSPAAGLRQTNVQIDVMGSGFVPQTTVSFGPGTAVAGIQVLSSNLLRADILIGIDAQLGPRDVVVTTPAPGGGQATLANGFTVLSQWPAPTLSSISPTSGEAGQSLTVALTGSGFIAGATSVSFGPGVTVNQVDVTSSTSLQAQVTIASAADPGTRTVTVTNPAPGGGSAQLVDGFTIEFPAPTITTVNPAQGGQGQSLLVTIAGTGFGPFSTVDFGDGIQVASITPSPTSMAVNITIDDDAEPGARTVTVENPAPGGGVATRIGGFTVVETIPAPTISGVTPGAIWRGQNGDIIVTGSGFVQGVTTVDFGAGVTVTLVNVTSPTQMEVSIDVPLETAAGTRDVIVTNPGAGTATLPGVFTVENPIASIGGVTPNTGARGTTLDVTIGGANFIQGVTQVSFGGTGISVDAVNVTSSTSLTATITIDASAATGPRSVTVTNSGPGGGSNTLSDVFTVQNPAPTLTSVTPANAPRGATGYALVLKGTGFIDGVTTVSIEGDGEDGDITVGTVTVTSDSTLQVLVTIDADATLGARNVTVTNPGPGGGSDTATLTIVHPAPVVNSITPDSGERGATGLILTFSGDHFIPGVTEVTFSGDGITVVDYTGTPPNTMNVEIEIAEGAALGPRDVTVSNGVSQITIEDAFTVANPAPTLTSLTPGSGAQGDTVQVTLTGTGFVPGTTVSFGAGITILDGSLVVNDWTTITVTVVIAEDAVLGTRDVTVTNGAPGGDSATLVEGFEVVAPPPPDE